MEEELSKKSGTNEDIVLAPAKEKVIPEVITVRTWKEYFGESLLIIFSVRKATYP
jgi:hypothetical protein